MTERSIAVIPARGGSKRIKRKNIRTFVDKPLIAYSIEAAKQSAVFADIVVSTDDADIGAIASDYGASLIIQRPDELADDHTGTSPVVRHAIDYYQQHKSAVDLVCCIYATAPFLPAQTIQQGLAQLQANNNAFFAFSVSTFDFPVQRALCLSGTGVAPVWPEYIAKRSQDLDERYHDAGQFYWGRSEAWLAGQPMFAAHSLPVVIPRHLVQDIDTEEDWIRAELMYKAYVMQTQLETN